MSSWSPVIKIPRRHWNDAAKTLPAQSDSGGLGYYESDYVLAVDGAGNFGIARTEWWPDDDGERVVWKLAGPDGYEFKGVEYWTDLPPAPSPILRQSVHSLGFSVRCRNIFARAGIETVADLVQRTDFDLLLERGIGVASLDEIRSVLGDHGLALAQYRRGGIW